VVDFTDPFGAEVEAMARQVAYKNFSPTERKEIFLALVEAQDGHMSVVQSRKEIAERFGISDRQLRRIEQEGVDSDWPPLG
jgi:transposase-like protein